MFVEQLVLAIEAQGRNVMMDRSYEVLVLQHQRMNASDDGLEFGEEGQFLGLVLRDGLEQPIAFVLLVLLLFLAPIVLLCGFLDLLFVELNVALKVEDVVVSVVEEEGLMAAALMIPEISGRSLLLPEELLFGVHALFGVSDGHHGSIRCDGGVGGLLGQGRCELLVVVILQVLLLDGTQMLHDGPDQRLEFSIVLLNELVHKGERLALDEALHLLEGVLLPEIRGFAAELALWHKVVQQGMDAILGDALETGLDDDKHGVRREGFHQEGYELILEPGREIDNIGRLSVAESEGSAVDDALLFAFDEIEEGPDDDFFRVVVNMIIIMNVSSCCPSTFCCCSCGWRGCDDEGGVKVAVVFFEDGFSPILHDGEISLKVGAVEFDGALSVLLLLVFGFGLVRLLLLLLL